jgi:hypothetical protein
MESKSASANVEAGSRADKTAQNKGTSSIMQHASTHSKPSSLMTEEDWDQALAREQGCAPSNTSIPLLESNLVNKGKGNQASSTPTSPSQILRKTKGDKTSDNHSIEEAKKFEKELGDWVSEVQSIL